MKRIKQRDTVFSPENEPYLGIKSIEWFDRIIIWTLEGNEAVATWTRNHEGSLTRLQHAACQIIPQGISIALSIREMIRQAYLFSALILIRSLMERAAIISYLDLNPDTLSLWEDGWRRGERPDLAQMLSSMSDRSQQEAQLVCSAHNHIVHGDPIGSYQNIIRLQDGSIGYSSGKMIDNHQLCDYIAMEAQCYLVVLTSRMCRIFPNVHIPEMPKNNMK